jgi:hypothetical protein
MSYLFEESKLFTLIHEGKTAEVISIFEQGKIPIDVHYFARCV